MVYPVLQIIVKSLLRLTFDTRVVVDGAIPSGNYIISSNHHSWLDPILITLVWPKDVDLMYIGPHDVVLNTFWKRWLIGGMHRVALSSERSGWIGKSAYRLISQGLDEGKSLLIFPEGDIFLQEGKVMPFYNGVAYFALKKGLPVIPVGLCGTADLYYRKRLIVHIGKPIHIPLTPRPDKLQLSETLISIRDCNQALVEAYQDPIVDSKPLHWLTHLM